MSIEEAVPTPKIKDERRAHVQKLTSRDVAPPTAEAEGSRVGIGARYVVFDYTLQAEGSDDPFQPEPKITGIEFSDVRWAPDNLQLHLTDMERLEDRLVAAALRHAHAHSGWPTEYIEPVLDRAENGEADLNVTRSDAHY